MLVAVFVGSHLPRSLLVALVQQNRVVVTLAIRLKLDKTVLVQQQLPLGVVVHGQQLAGNEPLGGGRASTIDHNRKRWQLAPRCEHVQLVLEKGMLLQENVQHARVDGARVTFAVEDQIERVELRRRLQVVAEEVDVLAHRLESVHSQAMARVRSR